MSFKTASVRKLKQLGVRQVGLPPAVLRDAVGCLCESEKVFASLLSNKAGVFQFKVSALNLALINREFLRQHGGGREGLSWKNFLFADLSFNLFAQLRVD